MQPKESFLDIIQQHIGDEKTILPVFNVTAKSILEKIDTKEPDLEGIEKLISRDPSLTAQVLRSANSSFYKGLLEVATIRNAVIRLGTGEISNIVLRLLQPETLAIEDPFSRELMAKLWQHAIGCAIGSHWLAKEYGFETLAQEAFIAGLLHDIGKLLLIAVVENLRRSGRDDLRPSNLVLNEVMEAFHAEHGYLLLKSWDLPESYCRVVREHHAEEVNPNDTLLIIVRLINLVCNKLGIGIIEDPTIILAATQEASMLGLSEIFLARLEITLEDIMVLKRDNNFGNL